MRSVLTLIAAALITVGIATSGVQAASPQQYYQPQYQSQYAPDDVRLVASWYERYLGREPDAIGLRQWVDQLYVGTNVQAGILGSDEYYIRHGSTPEGFVTGLYVDVLNRQPRWDEVQTWLNRLQQQGYNRPAMAADFLNAAAYELSIRGGTASANYNYQVPVTSTYVAPPTYRYYSVVPFRGFLNIGIWR